MPNTSLPAIDASKQPPNNCTAFDSATAIAAAVIVSFIGNGVFIGLPVITGAIADSLGFREEQLGWLASAETGGLLIAALITSALVTRINRRTLAVIGISLASVANLVASGISDFETLFGVRMISGFGGGICYSLGVACLAATHHTARNFSILIFGLVFMNAVELYTFPKISEHYGVAGIYITFAILFGAALTIVRWIPPFFNQENGKNSGAPTMGEPKQKAKIPSYIFLLCLAGVFFFYITISSFWTYAERAAVDAGLDDDFITNILTLGVLFSLLGCIAASWLGGQIGQLKGIMLSLLAMAGTLLLLASGITPSIYVVGLLLFNLLWNFIDIYLLGTIGNIDHTGRWAALVPAAQHLANTIGPSAAGMVLFSNLGYSTVFIFAAMGSVLAFCAYIAAYLCLKKISPALSDTT